MGKRKLLFGRRMLPMLLILSMVIGNVGMAAFADTTVYQEDEIPEESIELLKDDEAEEETTIEEGDSMENNSLAAELEQEESVETEDIGDSETMPEEEDAACDIESYQDEGDDLEGNESDIDGYEYEESNDAFSQDTIAEEKEKEPIEEETGESEDSFVEEVKSDEEQTTDADDVEIDDNIIIDLSEDMAESDTESPEEIYDQEGELETEELETEIEEELSESTEETEIDELDETETDTEITENTETSDNLMDEEPIGENVDLDETENNKDQTEELIEENEESVQDDYEVNETTSTEGQEAEESSIEESFEESLEDEDFESTEEVDSSNSADDEISLSESEESMDFSEDSQESDNVDNEDDTTVEIDEADDTIGTETEEAELFSSSSLFDSRLAAAKQKYPHGTYLGANYEFDQSWTCVAYAKEICYLVFGTHWSSWTRTERSQDPTLSRLSVGDYLWFNRADGVNGHAIFVTGISGDTIYYTDANWIGSNQVNWNGSITKSTLLNNSDRSFDSYRHANNYSDLFGDVVYPKIIKTDITEKTSFSFRVSATVEMGTYEIDFSRVQFLVSTMKDGNETYWRANYYEVEGPGKRFNFYYDVYDYDHNYVNGEYIVDIYVYDTQGNLSMQMVGSTKIQSLGITSDTPSKTLNGHTYYFVPDIVTWSEAKTACEKAGGHLATITSQEEQDIIQSALTGDASLSISGWSKSFPTVRQYMYIGGRVSNNKLTWITGETVSYTNWNPNEPNNDGGDEDVASLVLSSDQIGKWNDLRPNHEASGYICEIEPSPTGVEYSAYVATKNIWKAGADGNTAGIEAQSLRMEALKINLKYQNYSGDIEYSAHIQNVGWSDYVKNGSTVGTIDKRMEAIRVRLTGEMANKYDVYYRVYATDIGWMGWAKNDEKAGTESYGLPIEAYQVKLVDKGKAAPGSASNAFANSSTVLLEYSTHLNVDGWTVYASNGAESGAGDKTKRIEGIKIRVSGHPFTKNVIEYNALVQGTGWQGFVTSDKVSGTTGEGKRIEAIQVRLTGGMQNYLDVYYQVYVNNLGWLGWAKNGEKSGTENYGYEIRGIKILVKRKSDAPPTSTNAAFIEKEIQPQTVSVTGITLSKTSSTITVGESVSLSATVVPSNASNKNVTWSSNNTGVATVSAGKVTGIKAGTAVITAKTADGGFAASCTVTVNNKTVSVTGITLSKTSSSITVGESVSLSATVVPSNASNKNVTWSSNNTGVATVSAGKVTGIKAGTAIITAKTADGGFTASCTITVNAKVAAEPTNSKTISVTGITLNASSVKIIVGNDSNLLASVSPSNASNKNVNWSSSDTSVALVSSTGKVTAKKPGYAIITAKTSDGGYSANCKVNVIGVLLESEVELSETSYRYDGKAKKPDVTVMYGNKILQKNTDYTVKYKNNKNIGWDLDSIEPPSVVITGIGNYEGSVITKTFSIYWPLEGSKFTVSGLKYKITDYMLDEVSVIGASNKNIRSVKIPVAVTIGGYQYTVTSIGAKAFQKYKKLKTVTVGNDTVSIGSNAFNGCTALTTVTLGKKVKTIGASAFKGCTKLSKLTVNSTAMTTIGKQAFYGDKKLKTITFKSSKIKTVGAKAFTGVPSTAKVKVPAKKVSAYKKLFRKAGLNKKAKVSKG